MSDGDPAAAAVFFAVLAPVAWLKVLHAFDWLERRRTVPKEDLSGGDHS